MLTLYAMTKGEMGKEINVVDVFAGCGGLSYGFQQAGFRVILGIDNDFASKETFLANHKGSKYLCCDIRKLESKEILKEIGPRKVHVLIGGPPCQGFSLSGKRVFLDPRNSLYLEYFRLLDLCKPEIALVENVPGIKSLYRGKALRKIVEEFGKRGFTVSYSILRAEEFGVPQRRRRIFIVAVKGKPFVFPQGTMDSVSLGEAISDLPSPEDAQQCTKYKSSPVSHYQRNIRNCSDEIANHESTKHSQRTKQIIRLVPEGGNYRNLPQYLQKTRSVNIAWTRLDSKKPGLTIDTGHRHHFHPWEDRVPTVRECARIQSFPDTFVFKGSKTSQYRQVGNAVPPLLAKVLAGAIKRRLNGTKSL